MRRDTPPRDAPPAEQPRPRHGSASTPRSRGRSLGGDERGVSEILGAILLFGLVLLLVVLVQVSAVPSWNQQLEYEHNQRLQEDVQQLGSAIDAAAADGVDRSTVLETGVVYPSRPFLFNPPPGRGTIETVPREEGSAGTLRVENVAIQGVSNYPYVAGGIETTTRLVRYRDGYNQYQNAPTTVYENGVTYNHYDTGYVRAMDRGSLVNGTTINLVAIDGDLSTSSDRAATVRASSTSGPANPVTVTDSGGPLTVTSPTMLNESQWETILGSQYDETGSDPDAWVADVRVVDLPDQPYDRLELEMEPGTYTLRMAEVGLGSGVSDEGPAYVAAEDTTASAFQGGTIDVTFQLRDRYNNPVQNRELRFETSNAVTGATSNAGTVTPTTARTNSDGEVTVEYTASGSTGDFNVTALADVDGDGNYGEASLPAERVNVTVDVSVPGGGGGNDPDGDTVSAINPSPGSNAMVLENVLVSSGGPQQRTVTLCFQNDGPERSFSEARVSYYFPGTQSYPDDILFGTNYAPAESIYESTFQGVSVGAAVPTGGEKAVDVQVEKSSNFGGEFFILSTRFSDGTTSSYFIGLEQTAPGSTC